MIISQPTNHVNCSAEIICMLMSVKIFWGKKSFLRIRALCRTRHSAQSVGRCRTDTVGKWTNIKTDYGYIILYDQIVRFFSMRYWKFYNSILINKYIKYVTCQKKYYKNYKQINFKASCMIYLLIIVFFNVNSIQYCNFNISFFHLFEMTNANGFITKLSIYVYFIKNLQNISVLFQCNNIGQNNQFV